MAQETESGESPPDPSQKGGDGAEPALDPTQAPTEVLPSVNLPASSEDIVNSFGSMWSGFTSSVSTVVSNPFVTSSTATLSDAFKNVSTTVRSATESLDTESLRASFDTEALRTSTASLIASATSAVQDFDAANAGAVLTQNAESLFDAGGDIPGTGFSNKAPVAPWDDLPATERDYAEALREEMFKIVVDGIYSKDARKTLFLDEVAAKAGFSFDFERDGHRATGALAADSNLKRLRIGLVPRHLKENVFWDTYFYHVQRVRKELIANKGVLKQRSEEEERQREAASKAAADAESSRNAEGSKASEGQGRNWDDEIDKIFDDE